MFKTTISTDELSNHLDDPTWAIVDSRFDLAKPDWGVNSYQEAHIPGAVYAHLDHDLAGPVSAQTGRHPLPDIETMTHRLGNWGIAKDTQVVVYDSTGGAYAVRLWWSLRFLGHTRAAVLDGGFPKWQREGRPVASGVERRTPAQFISHPDWSMIVDAEEVERIRQDPAYRLVDARAAERYRGEREPIDPIAGRIPGAVNRFHGMNFSSEGIFLPPEVLRMQFNELVGATPPENVIVYCGSGVTSIHHILAMEIAGLPGARLYPGSWSEWIRDPHRPIERG
jgi:thiosulfate/3-mercaptopyruvate sulfurtransferase